MTRNNQNMSRKYSTPILAPYVHLSPEVFEKSKNENKEIKQKIRTSRN
jgi:hypothetical protein